MYKNHILNLMPPTTLLWETILRVKKRLRSKLRMMKVLTVPFNCYISLQLISSLSKLMKRTGWWRMHEIFFATARRRWHCGWFMSREIIYYLMNRFFIDFSHHFFSFDTFILFHSISQSWREEKTFSNNFSELNLYIDFNIKLSVYSKCGFWLWKRKWKKHCRNSDKHFVMFVGLILINHKTL